MYIGGYIYYGIIIHVEYDSHFFIFSSWDLEYFLSAWQVDMYMYDHEYNYHTGDINDIHCNMHSSRYSYTCTHIQNLAGFKSMKR